MVGASGDTTTNNNLPGCLYSFSGWSLHGIWFTWRGIPGLIKIFRIVPAWEKNTALLDDCDYLVVISWVALELIKRCQQWNAITGRNIFCCFVLKHVLNQLGDELRSLGELRQDW